MKEPAKQYREVSIRVTDKCNLKCPWCNNAHNVGTREEDGTALLAALKKNNYVECNTWSIIGGEPLMRERTVKEIFYTLSKDGWTIGLDRDLCIMTNARFLDLELFNWCMERKVRLDISISGVPNDGPKNLSLLMREGFFAQNPGIFTKYPEQVSLTVVVDPRQPFHHLTYLNDVFGCNVSIAFDTNILPDLSGPMISSIEHEIALLKEHYTKRFRRPNDPKMFIKRFPLKKCEGEGLFYNPDGTWYECKDVIDLKGRAFHKGCMESVSLVGAARYARIAAAVSDLMEVYK